MHSDSTNNLTDTNDIYRCDYSLSLIFLDAESFFVLLVWEWNNRRPITISIEELFSYLLFFCCVSIGIRRGGRITHILSQAHGTNITKQQTVDYLNSMHARRNNHILLTFCLCCFLGREKVSWKSFKRKIKSLFVVFRFLVYRKKET